ASGVHASSPLAPARPPSLWNFSVKAAHYSAVVRQLVEDGLVASRTVLYDLDAIDTAFQALVAPFPSHFEHRFTVASCPLAFFLRRAIENDVGLTCTSIVEVQHALRLGCAPHKIVFNSPYKSPHDIAYAINASVEVNADSFDELELIRTHAQQRFQSNFPECTPRYAGELPRIGVRVHACAHEGAAAVGIPLTKANRARLVQAFVDNPWISGLQATTCAGGCGGNSDDPMRQLAHGAAVVCDLANEIDAVVGEDRVQVLHIGGRLAANFDSDDVVPSLSECVEALRADAPKVLERNGRSVVTEFGQYVSAKVGWTIFQVEHVEDVAPSSDASTTTTAVVHAGADLFATLASDGRFQHRLSLFKSDGLSSTADVAPQQLVCFDSDRGVATRPVTTLPRMMRGDLVVLHDTGANAMVQGLGCAPAPPVYGYRKHEDVLKMVLLKPAETPEQVMQAWG
ncbi:hypothetical protein As57867_020917, partial [Aphanomyces stellatus]